MRRIEGAWLDRAATRSVCTALENAGHQVFFVGGCVRNALLRTCVSDIDIATDARPDRVTEIMKGEGFRVVPTGIDHGTVTVLVDAVAHEITTFRKDVGTDGRRAVVRFTTDITADARRRDFTMNALYADMRGRVTDPVGGLADLTMRRLRFIGLPEERIREDHLRILRFFRLHAWYGDPDRGLDEAALMACKALQGSLDSLPKERIGAEMRKLLLAPDPGAAVAAMEWSGILTRLLPGAAAGALPLMIRHEADLGLAVSFPRRLAVIGGRNAQTMLRLGKADLRMLDRLRAGLESAEGAAVFAYRHGAGMALDRGVVAAALAGRSISKNLSEEATRGASQIFPVGAADLMPRLRGAALGAKLKELETRWIASDFEQTREQLLT
ncbi:MAG: CCA tRNA nucleotidyltransferase [Pseudomonadota bacterium]